MSRKGNCYDNSVMETFFGRLKREIYYGIKKEYSSFNAFSVAIEKYINYYNYRRIHKNWTTSLRLNTGDGSPRVLLLNSHFLRSDPITTSFYIFENKYFIFSLLPYNKLHFWVVFINCYIFIHNKLYSLFNNRKWCYEPFFRMMNITSLVYYLKTNIRF